MTKEKIIEVFSRKAKEIIIAKYKVDDRYIFTNQGKEAVAEELFALIEQEKKEETREILQDLKEYIAYETKPFIKWGSDNPKDEIPAACIDSDILNNKIDELAKEYEVEL